MSLPKRFRLKKRKDFELVKKKGKLFPSSSFSLLVFKDQKSADSLFGFIISKKVSKKAVARNRIRRRIASALSLLLKQVKPGYKVIFLAKAGALTQPFPQLKKEVEEALKRSQVLRDA